jgi:quercetin dioxygenase-like cupin family protein
MTVNNFSSKMKNLRRRKKISLTELSEKTGYSEAYLKKIEENEVIAPVSVILSVAQAFSVATEDLLLSRQAKKQRNKEIKERKETFDKRTENYSYKVLTPRGKHKHLNAFKVTIEPLQEHRAVAYHHTGEEFIYVLSGEMEIKIGRTVHGLKTGESIHFDSSKSHILRSISKKPTVILVTIYTP